jgi:YVTN family beta-propeller protein
MRAVVSAAMRAVVMSAALACAAGGAGAAPLVAVSDEDAGEAAIVDVRAARVVGRVRVGGEPEGVAVRPDGRVAYVTSEAEDVVTVVDLAASRPRAVERIPVCARPRAVVFTRDGTHAYVSCERGGAVAVLDARAHAEIDRIALPHEAGAAFAPMPMGLALSPDEETLYVATGRHGTVAAIDVAQATVVRSSPTGAPGVRPWGLATDGTTLYVANGPTGDLALLDAATGALRRSIPVGRSP